MPQPTPINLAILVSGSGSTLGNLIDVIARGELCATILKVIGSREDLGAQRRAVAAGIDYEIVRRRDFASVYAFSARIFDRCDTAAADLVVCAGWLALLDIPPRYQGRVINVHPSLLPKFGGKGMFGRHVHEAVLAAGERRSGCTVHFVNNDYDAGPVILRRSCEVLADDDACSLARRVQELERADPA